MPFCAPQIVYSNSWTNQTAAIGSTSFFTTPTAGMYRISVVLSAASNSNASANIGLHVPITDNRGGTVAFGAGCTPAQAPAFDEASAVCYLAASSSLAFSTTLNTWTGTSDYDVFIVVEQLL